MNNDEDMLKRQAVAASAARNDWEHLAPKQPGASAPAALRAAALRHVRQAVVEGYESLHSVLSEALHQAQSGKGAERHANSKPFIDQPMQTIAERRGIGFLLGQVDKKTEEAQGMLERGEIDAWEREILGAINYLAGSIIHVRKNGRRYAKPE